MRAEQYRRHKAGLVTKQLDLNSRANMIALRLAGHRPSDLTKRFKVSRSTVWRILRLIPAMVLIGICTVGCDRIVPQNVTPIAPPKLEQPVLQLPVPLRQRNWTVRGEGSCVYASLTTVARWVHRPDIAKWLSDPTQNGGGEYGTRLRQRLDEVGVQYSYTDRASVAFLDWCNESRRGAIVWWKTSHCCTFAGWVSVNGKRYAAIIDNNHPETFELTEANLFISEWTRFGGFGLTLLYDPASPRPWLSYTVN
jgi:hypothetical protein